VTFPRCKIYPPITLLLTQTSTAQTRAPSPLAIGLCTFRSYSDKTSSKRDYEDSQRSRYALRLVVPRLTKHRRECVCYRCVRPGLFRPEVKGPPPMCPDATGSVWMDWTRPFCVQTPISKKNTLRSVSPRSPSAPDVPGAYNVNSCSGCVRPGSFRPEVKGPRPMRPDAQVSIRTHWTRPFLRPDAFDTPMAQPPP